MPGAGWTNSWAIPTLLSFFVWLLRYAQGQVISPKNTAPFQNTFLQPNEKKTKNTNAWFQQQNALSMVCAAKPAEPKIQKPSSQHPKALNLRHALSVIL
ncbi:hypothetical protein FN846DRAFT_956510 [Sphaerosporella brunnea]|uniref:Secreted protein n=1 Tax=Sphaerosporella brunnea TaxID=1250544 RepID=A0A5J5ESC6_9PEZI|nr:hypothetical protein FN846DRAFT_956510 [Sphaerosporella brunnea]